MVDENSKKNDLVYYKADRLIQKTMPNSSLMNNRTICVLLCNFVQNPLSYNGELISSEISIHRILRLMDMEPCAQNYQLIKGLLDSEIFDAEFVSPDDPSIKIHYFHSMRIDPDTNMIQFVWSSLIAPYLINLLNGTGYTKFRCSSYLSLGSPRSQYLYELLKSYEKQKRKRISVNELRKKLHIRPGTTFDQFKFFNSRVLKKCISEINAKTDILVRYSVINEGRKAAYIDFVITGKDESVDADAAADVTPPLLP